MNEKIIPSRGVFVGEVVANQAICDEHYLMSLALAAFPPTLPGQFVQLQCRPTGQQISVREVNWPQDRPPVFTQPELTNREPLLRRPFSLAGRRQDPGGRAVLEILYRVVGAGTRWLAGLERGQTVSVLGPLGNAFDIPPDRDLSVMVAGGVGIGPMLYLADALAKAGKKSLAFCGVRSANLLPLKLPAGAEVSPKGIPTMCVLAELAADNTETAIATDDGSLGFAGFVSEAFGCWLAEHEQPADRVVVYCCGPEEMMRHVAELCIRRGIDCQLALERHMACGMGTCQSCVVKIRDDTPQGWSFKLCCADGPIFDAQEVAW